MPNEDKGYQEKTSEELVILLEEKDGQIKTLEEAKLAEGPEKPVEDAEKKLAEDKEKKLAESKEKKPAEGTSTEGETKELSEVKKNMDETTKTLAEKDKRIKELEERNRKQDIEISLKKFTDAGMPKVVTDKGREIMTSDNSATTYELSEKNSDGKTTTKKQASLTECIIALMETIPVVQLGETTVVTADGSSDSNTQEAKDAEIEKVKKYAEEHKLDFGVAARKMMAEKKIQTPKVAVRQD